MAKKEKIVELKAKPEKVTEEDTRVLSQRNSVNDGPTKKNKWTGKAGKTNVNILLNLGKLTNRFRAVENANMDLLIPLQNAPKGERVDSDW